MSRVIGACLLLYPSLKVKVEISGSSLSTNDKGNVPHFCVFCEKPQARLKRYLLAKHKDEKTLIPLMNAGKDRVKQELTKLRHAGDHAHNVKVLQSGNGITWLSKGERESKHHQMISYHAPNASAGFQNRISGDTNALKIWMITILRRKEDGFLEECCCYPKMKATHHSTKF